MGDTVNGGTINTCHKAKPDIGGVISCTVNGGHGKWGPGKWGDYCTMYRSNIKLPYWRYISAEINAEILTILPKMRRNISPSNIYLRRIFISDPHF